MTPRPINPPALRSVGTRLRVEVMEPRPKCPNRPNGLFGLFETVTGRSHSGSYGQHSACSTPCACSRPQTRRLLAPTVIREDEEGEPWLMNREEGGWGERGVRLRSWGEALEYAVTFGEQIEWDEDGRFIRVFPVGGYARSLSSPHSLPPRPAAAAARAGRAARGERGTVHGREAAQGRAGGPDRSSGASGDGEGAYE